MHEWYLESTSDADLSVCIVLNEIREYTIGRRRGYDIVSPNPLVSRNHGILTVKPNGDVFIKDLKSANGTYINDKIIEPFKEIPLKENDLLGIGAPSDAEEPKKEIFLVQCRHVGRIPPKEIVSYEVDSTIHEEYHQEAENAEKINEPTISAAQCANLKQKKSSCEDIASVSSQNEGNIKQPIIKAVQVSEIKQEKISCEDIVSISSQSVPHIEEPVGVLTFKSVEEINLTTFTAEQIPEIKQEKNLCEDISVLDSLQNGTKLVEPAIMIPEIKQERNSCDVITEIPNNLNNGTDKTPNYESTFSKNNLNSSYLKSDISKLTKQKNIVDKTVQNNLNKKSCTEDKEKKIITSKDNNSVNITNKNLVSDVKKFSKQNSREESNSKENNLNTKPLLDKQNKNGKSNHVLTNNTVQENDSNEQSCLLNVMNKSSNSSLKDNNIQENNLNINVCSVNNESSSITSKNNILSESNNDDLNKFSASSNEDAKLSSDYLQSLLQKCRKTKESYGEFVICPSSDEENEKLNIFESKPSTCKNKIKYEAFEDSDDVIFIEKPIKTEQNNQSFTQNDFDDIIAVSDDDDDIFPKSQLFEIKEEPVEDDHSKTGDCTSPVSEINDNDKESVVKNEVQEYDYSDNEEEDDNCIIWYTKLSQSLGSSQKITEDSSSKSPIEVKSDNFITFNDKDLEIFDEHQEEELIADEEQSKAKDVPELDDTTDSRSVETTLPSIEEKEEEQTSKKKIDNKKLYLKPPVIDAPFLKKGKRKTTEETKSKETSSSVSKRRKSSHEEVSSVSLDKSVKNELLKRNKKRRKSTETYTKDEKQKIQEDRKKKLKELASKKTEKKEKKEEKKHSTKPKVKVSTGRGLFLVAADPKPEIEKRKKADATLREEPLLKKPFKIPKRSNSITSEPSTSKKNKLSFNDLEPNVKNINNLPFNNFAHREKEHIDKNKTILTNNNITYKNNTLKGILQHPNRKKKSGNRVRFAEKPQIREIERLPGNIGRKVNSKDAPIPVINNTKNVDEVLETVLGWQPTWLEQQKAVTESPPGLSSRKFVNMTSNFKSYGDYCDTVIPLMLLELWRSIFKDWCEKNSPVNLACIESSVLRHDGLYLTCYCLSDKENPDNYPKRGDLLVAEFYLVGVNPNAKATNKKFGYVLNGYRRRMTPTDIVHKQFMGMGRVPQFKISFTMVINPLQIKILEDKLMRIRFVSNIPHMLRVYKAVSYLQHSPLRSLILTPNVQQYKITRPTQMTSATKDLLNNDQMMCVYEAYQICTRNEPGIYLIQGPPGTGKSYVIKNLVWQLLCDSSKNQNLQNLRILLCAPSNGAIDEITNTLLQMRSQMSENRFKMIRLGNPSSITKSKVKNISVQNLVFNHLAEQQNNALKTNVCLNDEYNFLIQKENTFKNKIVSLEDRKLDSSFEVKKLKEVQAKIEQLKSNCNVLHERRKLERDSECTIIEKAQIICSTLSSCINSRFEEVVIEKKMEFTCCIIDEATQSDESYSLIPLILGIDKFVLVGDPEQLPPTVISSEAKALGYGNSLFKRIQSCLEHLPDNPIRMLTEQYRMHPEICKFPSNYIYGGRLKTAEAVMNKIEYILDPCRLFCLNGTEHYQRTEYLNTVEAKFVLLLTDIVVRKTKYNVGIITPYSKQKSYLTTKYNEMRKKESKENQEKEDKDRYQPRVVINTVDGFQGQERDVIIISTVRYQSNVFLNDLQRANVALTRAKHAVFICGHANLFKTDSLWKKLEIDAKSRNFFYLITEKDSTDEKYISELILRN